MSTLERDDGDLRGGGEAESKNRLLVQDTNSNLSGEQMGSKTWGNHPNIYRITPALPCLRGPRQQPAGPPLPSSSSIRVSFSQLGPPPHRPRAHHASPPHRYPSPVPPSCTRAFVSPTTRPPCPCWCRSCPRPPPRSRSRPTSRRRRRRARPSAAGARGPGPS